MKQAYRRKGVVAMPFLVNHLVEIGYLWQGEAIRADDINTDDEIVTEAMYHLTADGRMLVEKWELK